MDFDLDSAMFPMMTAEVLIWFTGLLMVHLSNSQHVVSDLCHMVFIGDFGWKMYAIIPDSVKKLVCREISQMGPMVYLSLKNNIHSW